MGLRISLMARKEITKSKAKEYARASKKEKSKILDSICDLTGWCRDNARKKLKQTYRESLNKNKKPKYKAKKYKYSYKARQILSNAWMLSGCCCGQYFVVQVENCLLERLIKNKRLKDGVKNRGNFVKENDKALKEIKNMSSATIDRYLSKMKKHLQPLSRGTTKPAKCSLCNEIPFGKSYEKHEEPGWLSTDTVAHCGSNLRGEFLYTLNSTDVFTGWTETITVKNKASVHIREGHEELIPRFPFGIHGINYDGGSEFINREIIDYSKMQKYIMTRSRPYHSNDNAHVEQKNGDIVRRYAFRNRYEGEKALKILNELWEWVNLQKNYLIPTKKVTGHTKTKSGRTRGIYDKPKTPAQRVLESENVAEEIKDEIRKSLSYLDDAYVVKRILDLQDELLTLSCEGNLLELVEEVQEMIAA